MELKYDVFRRFAASEQFVDWCLRAAREDADFLQHITVETNRMEFFENESEAFSSRSDDNDCDGDDDTSCSTDSSHTGGGASSAAGEPGAPASRSPNRPRKITTVGAEHISDALVDELERRMRDPGAGVQIRDRKRLLRTYESAFTGAEAAAYVVAAEGCNRHRAAEILQAMFDRNIIRGWNTRTYVDSSTKLYRFVQKKRLVIIGGGYAGLKLARELRYEYDVTLVEKKPAFEYFGDFPRMTTDPALIKKIQLPYDRRVLCDGKVAHI